MFRTFHHKQITNFDKKEIFNFNVLDIKTQIIEITDTNIEIEHFNKTLNSKFKLIIGQI